MLSTLTLSLALTLPATADDPKAIVEKAIKAHGGAAALDKYKAHRVQFAGTVTAMGMELEMKGQLLAVWPDKIKVKATLSVGGQEVPLEQIINGKSFRMSIGGNVIPIPDEQVEDGLASAYAASLGRLTPLLTADYTLKSAAAATVDGKKAIGVLVTRKDRPDVTMHFDADTGRHVQTTRKGLAEDGSEVDRVTVHSDYRLVDGLQVSHKETVTVGGKKSTELTTEKYEPLDKLDASEFAID